MTIFYCYKHVQNITKLFEIHVIAFVVCDDHYRYDQTCAYILHVSLLMMMRMSWAFKLPPALDICIYISYTYYINASL